MRSVHRKVELVKALMAQSNSQEQARCLADWSSRWGGGESSTCLLGDRCEAFSHCLASWTNATSPCCLIMFLNSPTTSTFSIRTTRAWQTAHTASMRLCLRRFSESRQQWQREQIQNDRGNKKNLKVKGEVTAYQRLRFKPLSSIWTRRQVCSHLPLCLRPNTPPSFTANPQKDILALSCGGQSPPAPML